eukprot:TRINITY_DN222_c0_g1_i1.p2 TRINITY_DN222_c0_g1~~TRINITY_DN222_c0_g1_i1.p2  ORF type:complete len:210 (-),score=43.28 TRINITY_DN222_c0_g1_i1:92-721(-)
MEEVIAETTKPKMATNTELDSAIAEEGKNIDKWQNQPPKINPEEDVIDEKIESTGDKVAATENKETNFNFELVEEPVDLAGKVESGGEIIENKRDGPEHESYETNKKKIEETLTENELVTNPDCEFSIVEEGDNFCEEQSQSPKVKAGNDMIDEKIASIDNAEAATDNEESNRNFNLVEQSVDLVDNLAIGGVVLKRGGMKLLKIREVI